MFKNFNVQLGLSYSGSICCQNAANYDIDKLIFYTSHTGTGVNIHISVFIFKIFHSLNIHYCSSKKYNWPKWLNEMEILEINDFYL